MIGSRCNLYQNIWTSRVKTYTELTEKAKRELDFWEYIIDKCGDYSDQAFITEKYNAVKNEYRLTSEYLESCKKEVEKQEKKK